MTREIDPEIQFAIDHHPEVQAAADAIRAETWPNGTPFAPGNWANMLARVALFAAHQEREKP